MNIFNIKEKDLVKNLRKFLKEITRKNKYRIGIVLLSLLIGTIDWYINGKEIFQLVMSINIALLLIVLQEIWAVSDFLGNSSEHAYEEFYREHRSNNISDKIGQPILTVMSIIRSATSIDNDRRGFSITGKHNRRLLVFESYNIFWEDLINT
ncbi:MAG: hypothetical protein QM487_05470 [Candidatus Marithrix sp.]